MNTLLNSALMLTLIGMGMTFAAIGLLVVGMYAMTAFIKDRAKRSQDMVASSPALKVKGMKTGIETYEAQRIAAAAAVSTALASQSDKTIAAVAAVAAAMAAQPTTAASPSQAPTAWNIYVRGQYLNQRKYYDVRRLHKSGS